MRILHSTDVKVQKGTSSMIGKKTLYTALNKYSVSQVDVTCLWLHTGAILDRTSQAFGHSDSLPHLPHLQA